MVALSTPLRILIIPSSLSKYAFLPLPGSPVIIGVVAPFKITLSN